MYQYSLPWFIALLLGAARDAERSDDVPVRLAAVQRQFALSLYRCGAATVCLVLDP
jgi:hypothetical protein